MPNARASFSSEQMDSIHMQMTDLGDGTMILAINQHLVRLLDLFIPSSSHPKRDSDFFECNFRRSAIESNIRNNYMKSLPFSGD
jgi:hypothetical protein